MDSLSSLTVFVYLPFNRDRELYRSDNRLLSSGREVTEVQGTVYCYNYHLVFCRINQGAYSQSSLGVTKACLWELASESNFVLVNDRNSYLSAEVCLTLFVDPVARSDWPCCLAWSECWFVCCVCAAVWLNTRHWSTKSAIPKMFYSLGFRKLDSYFKVWLCQPGIRSSLKHSSNYTILCPDFPLTMS